MAAVNNSCQQYVTVWLFTIFMKPILFSVFRFIRTFYLVVYNLMQGALFLYITSVLLYKLLFQGTGTVEVYEIPCLLVIHVRTFEFIVSTTQHQLKTMNLNDDWTTCVLRFFPTSIRPLTICMERTSYQDSNRLYFSPVKGSSAAKSHHERILPPHVFFNWSFIISKMSNIKKIMSKLCSFLTSIYMDLTNLQSLSWCCLENEIFQRFNKVLNCFLYSLFYKIHILYTQNLFVDR